VGSRPSSLVVAKNQVIPAQCEGILMARLEWFACKPLVEILTSLDINFNSIYIIVKVF
jgi:hypothetical protein